MGHIARYYPLKNDWIKKKSRNYHARATEENESDKETVTKKEDSSEEYVLISALTGAITHGSDIWIIDNGASKHMTGHKDSLSCLTQKDYSHKVQL